MSIRTAILSADFVRGLMRQLSLARRYVGAVVSAELGAVSSFRPGSTVRIRVPVGRRPSLGIERFFANLGSPHGFWFSGVSRETRGHRVFVEASYSVARP